MVTTLMLRVGFQLRRAVADLFEDSSGMAAIEFSFILPIMLVMFFGTIEFSSGVAVDRKVTLISRTLSDLTSQAPSDPTRTYAPVNNTYLQNVFTASMKIVDPYLATPLNSTISQIYVDSNAVAKISWSKAATISSGASQATLVASPRNTGDNVTSLVPTALLVKKTYLILSEVSYLYVPVGIGYVMKTNLTLSDLAFTRARQATCVIYKSLPAAASCPLT
jgi:Flp pilus assembly protein TadG